MPVDLVPLLEETGTGIRDQDFFFFFYFCPVGAALLSSLHLSAPHFSGCELEIAFGC